MNDRTEPTTATTVARLSSLPPEWIDFYEDRDRCKRDYTHPRCYGISSDALAMYALGLRETEPQIGEYPHDWWDLEACELTYAMAPDVRGLRERMLPVLQKYRARVGEDNRHTAGWRVHMNPPG